MAFFAVEGLTKRFGGLTALDDVSFEVERATIFSVIGPNGSGKSTAFNCISGIHRPTAGSVQFDGEQISGLGPHHIARRGIARTFQNIELFGNESTIDNLMLGRHQHMTTGVWRGLAMLNGRTHAARDECENRARVQHILELLDLDAVRERPVRELPYGTQKRVELARALAMEPKLLLVDEPTAGMNAHERTELGEQLGRLRADLDLTILLIEHHLQLAMGLADQVLVLNFGKPIAQGTPEEVRRHPDVIKAYLGDG
ncbi:MAG TPA: ABC transporter ATP-binding protein [Gemmatimonadetes bacterium]|nr:ABC transporter ATP-binding protein [Gemmatimonadota bacterium]